MSAFSALEVFKNDLRYINSRFTYLLTYLLTHWFLRFKTWYTKTRWCTSDVVPLKENPIAELSGMARTVNGSRFHLPTTHLSVNGLILPSRSRSSFANFDEMEDWAARHQNGEQAVCPGPVQVQLSADQAARPQMLPRERLPDVELWCRVVSHDANHCTNAKKLYH